MEAGASECPTWMNSPWVATERRTKGASPRLRVANVSEPPGALIEPSRGLRFFLEAQGLGGGGGRREGGGGLVGSVRISWALGNADGGPRWGIRGEFGLAK